jgi:hypothetical protein
MLTPDVLSSYDGGSAIILICCRILAIAAPVSVLYISVVINDIRPVNGGVTRSMPAIQATIALNLRHQVLSAKLN